MKQTRISILALLFLILSLNGIAQTLQLHYSGHKQSIINAVAEANKILSNPDFYKRIDTIQKFDNSTYSGLQIANEMKAMKRIIEVEEYHKALSKCNAKTQTVIKINNAKLNRSLASITNTLIHETVHFVDWNTNYKWNYTHKGQKEEIPPISGQCYAKFSTFSRHSAYCKHATMFKKQQNRSQTVRIV